MSGGYMGKLLFVDLSTGKIREETTDASLCRDFIGGYGIGARVLYNRQKSGVDPLGSDSILGFVTGPLTGTPAIGGSRFAVVGKSPLTGGWGDAAVQPTNEHAGGRGLQVPASGRGGAEPLPGLLPVR